MSNIETDARLERAEKKIELLTRRLDEALRYCRLAPIIDNQIIAINARSPRGGNAA